VLTGLLPAVTSPAQPAASQAVQWTNAAPTLEQVQASLATLVTEAPDEARGGRAQRLGDALLGVRQAVATDLGLRTGSSAIPADAAAIATSAATVQAARDRLAAAVATIPAPAGQAGAPGASPGR
jgi:hypothetical protein